MLMVTNSTVAKILIIFIDEDCIYVVVQFYPWFNFYFPLFFFM